MTSDVNVPTQADLPSLPRDEDGPVFDEPWQAQAFAMTVWLHEQGHFTWPEWAEHLGAEIAAAVGEGDPDLGDTYYLHWLKALETLVAEKGLLTAGALADRKEAWDRAAHATPHGQPIVLPPDA
ncbi:MAG: nitrile hydratase accessory protein [Alphaproteobacteria bacterium]|jgi:nitrile hydratase accessory protein|nr:nitrile hydratase accessory protein [Alphaproteobacteria bacterium]MDP6831269.1 nitrile hydratase accessory protein [Alphaproteobacteria bacterium]MDP6873620.1 nitrile hydratase accessory protein [Alphaproteobacteria bacterium]